MIHYTSNTPTSILVLLAVAAWAMVGTLNPALAQDAEKNIVVHIGQYSNDLHSATMGVSLAGKMQEAGAEVTIFVDREAVRMGEQGQPLLRYGDSDLEILLSDFLEGGGSVLVCPHCAELGGVEPGELRSGFTMGTPESIAALFLNADTVISY
ncbi:MAG: hypothetical protein GVY25_14095 [Bacteroidetes bacterium]|jgi:sulfur relay (sulfurtransferase) complex TusBCD TusD component (DsrE family)|nr:hypothetical protein [Bacteroidota bacterium]